MKAFMSTIILVLAGCHTTPIPESPKASLPLAKPMETRNARIPAIVGHYTLGAYVDPENALIRHEAHTIQRVEAEAHWDLRPTSLHLPDKPEVEAVLEEEPIIPLIEETPVAVVTSVAPIPSKTPEPTREPAIMPNSEGVIDLTSLGRDSTDEINPFAVRLNQTPREVPFHVGGIIHGPTSCVIVNGHPLQPGDVIESLILEDVEPNAALFRYQGNLVRVPVAAQPIRLLMTL